MFENLFSPEGNYARVMNFIWNLLVLNFLWIVCCLPIVTIGASSTAAYYAAAKVLRHKNGKIPSEFFRSFRLNLRQSLPLSILSLLLLLVLAAECIYLYSDSSVPAAVVCLFMAMLLIILALFGYLWPCLSRFSKGSFSLFQMSMVLTFRHFFTTIELLALVCICIVGIYFMPWGILIFPGAAWYLSTYLMERILLKYSPKVSEDDPHAQMWYYQ